MWESTLYAGLLALTLWLARKRQDTTTYANMIAAMWLLFHAAGALLSYRAALTVDVWTDALAAAFVFVSCGPISLANWRFVVFLTLFVQVVAHQWYGHYGEPKRLKFAFDFVLFRMLDVQLLAVTIGPRCGELFDVIRHHARDFLYAPPRRTRGFGRSGAMAARRKAR